MFKLHNICIEHSGKKLLQNISLDLSPGEVLAVIGPNGAGKSTLLKTLSADLTPASGSIQLDNKALGSYSKKQLAQTRAVLPQSAEMYFPFTVQEIVEMGRTPHSNRSLSMLDKDIVMQSMEITQVADFKDRTINNLSGGERQRVQLARVLCQILGAEQNDRYLLLDEPTSALDLSHQHHVLSIVAELAKQHQIGVMVILHDLNLAALYADKLVVLKKGEITHYGAPDDILQAQPIQTVFGISVDATRHPSHACQLIISNRNAPSQEVLSHVF